MRIGVLVGIGSIALLSACGPEPQYLIQRSALVAHPTPPMSTGSPMTGPVELAGRSSTVLMPITPSEARNANAGLYVARHNLAAQLRLRTSERSDLSLLVETGLTGNAMAIADDSLPVPDLGATRGGGMGFQYSAKVSDHVSLGLTFDLMLMSIPFRETDLYVENCERATPYWRRQGREIAPIFRFAVLPSYRADRVTAYGGLTAVNHPVITKRQIAGAWSAEAGDAVSSGPFYYLLGAGLDYRAGGIVHLFAEGFVPTSRSIVSYGPSIGFGLRLSFENPAE